MSDKIVFLTGGTGSFGQGFVSHLLNDREVSMVRVYSRDEHKQTEMRKYFQNDRVSFYIGDIRDMGRLVDAMDGSNYVVHAAALKQAPMGEIEPQEFIKTNILGSMNVVNAALALGVEKAILISTDKAVEPINLYGATKMCAERIFIQADKMRGTRLTRFGCTRYGNVAGTKGSIIPLLMSLGPNEPSIIYDPEATRFWITLEDAYEFVLDSLKEMEGGEIFIPRLKSVRVKDIVEAVRGQKPIVIRGPRIGDKRHEVLDVNYTTGERYSSDKNEFLSVFDIREHVYKRNGISLLA